MEARIQRSFQTLPDGPDPPTAGVHRLIHSVGKHTDGKHRQEPAPFEQPAESHERLARPGSLIGVARQPGPQEEDPQRDEQTSARRDAELTDPLQRQSGGGRNRSPIHLPVVRGRHCLHELRGPVGRNHTPDHRHDDRRLEGGRVGASVPFPHQCRRPAPTWTA